MGVGRVTKEGPVPIEGFAELRRLGGAVASPDGQKVAFAVTRHDREKNGYASGIWLYDHAAGSTRAFTAGPADASPAWAPDGSALAFLGVRGDDTEPQVYLIGADGGEARRLSKGLRGAAGIAWSPAGDAIALVAYKDEQEAETADLWQALSAADALPAEGERNEEVRISARLKFRYDGAGYTNDRRRHICIVPVTDEATEGRFVTSGAFDVGSVRWHPSGGRLTFALGRANDRGDEAWMTDVFEVDAAGGEARFFLRTGGRASGISWSPAGDRFLVLGDDFGCGPATDPAAWLYDGAGRNATKLLAGLDRPVGPLLFGDTSPLGEAFDVAWDADGHGLYLQVLDHGSVVPYHIRLDGPEERVTRLVPDGWVGNCASLALGDGRLWCVIDQSDKPSELWELPLDRGSARRVSDIQTSRVAAWQPRAHQTLRYPSKDGRFEIEAFVTLPHGFEEGRRYPLLLVVHGGPHGAFGHVFEHEVQYNASQGRVVLQVNPRGSFGYGQDLTRGCLDDWGGGDYEDIMAGVDRLIERGWVDPARMAVNGISYGGFMTSWIITHTTRFACAVPEMLVSDLISMWGTSDIGWFLMETEIPGSPMKGHEALWAHSPLASVGNCTTPTLVIEGEDDFRCPIGQGEELYTALRRQGIEAVLVRLRGASHIAAFVGPPRQRLARKSLIERWLVRHGVASEALMVAAADATAAAAPR